MNRNAPNSIVVFGSSQAKENTPNYLLAYELGEILTKNGYAIVNGGYRGSMEATARAAKENGGTTTGVTCEIFSRSGPNLWIDKEIKTNNLHQRLERLIHAGDGYVALPGSTGTLLEIAMVWELMNKAFLTTKPLIFLGDYWRAVVDTIVHSGEADGRSLYFADSVENVIELLHETLTSKTEMR